MIVRTDAISLRWMEYGETSRIVTLYTRQMGKISVLARGARTSKSRFGSSLQPLSYCESVFYYKPSRQLQTLSENSLVNPFHRIGRDLGKMEVGMRIIEWVNSLVHEEEQNPLTFNLLLQVLSRLDASEERFSNLLPYFQLRMAMLLGFAPDVDRDLVTAIPEAGGILALESGAPLPPEHGAGRGTRASRAALRAYAVLACADLDIIMRMSLSPDIRLEVNDLVDGFLRFHVEDLRPSRTEKVFDQIRASGR
jgi:DNA repair protein RecO (recombination protein O)